MNNFLEIKNQIKIFDVLKHYADLKKKGKNYWTLCPFHQDQSPSLSISEDKNIFKCFSCGASGDAVTFVMKFDKLTFIDAIKKISTLINLDIDFLKKTSNFKNENINKKIYKLNELITQAQHKYLWNKENESVLSYLINTRKISEELIKKFQLGICSENNILTSVIEKWNLLNKENLLNEEIIDKSKNFIFFPEGKRNFFLAKRIIFPIWNSTKNIVGFSGRTLQSNDSAKYLNSSESLVFKKSESLYNIQNIVKEQDIYIFEGFFDLISAQKCNVFNSVSLMGTSFSKYQINQLKSFSNNLIFVLDNDQAGITATIQLAKKAIEEGFNVYVIDLLNEKAKDIDSLIVDDLTIAKAKLNNKINFFDWYKKYWEKTNSKVKFDELKNEISKLLSFLFFFSNNKTFLKSKISIEYTKESLIQIFNFYSLWQETDVSKEAVKELKKYIGIISKPRTLEKEEKVFVEQFAKKNKQQNFEQENFLKNFIFIFDAWNENKKEIQQKFITKEWVIDWQMLFEFTTQYDSFFCLVKKTIEEVPFSSEEIIFIEKYKPLFSGTNLKNDISYFFNLYYSLIKFLIEEQAKKLQTNSIFSFEEKIKHKNKIAKNKKKVESVSLATYKKILLFNTLK